MAMCEAKGFRPCERDELMTLVKGLQRQIAQLQGQNAQLAAANERLSKQLAELQRAGKRQAAPFSKGRRTSSPKRPGRKPGQGMFSYRKLPSPDQVTEPIVEVTVRCWLPRCCSPLPAAVRLRGGPGKFPPSAPLFPWPAVTGRISSGSPVRPWPG